MFLITGVLIVLAGLFYLAGTGDIRMLSSVCSYTDQIFCRNPQWFLYAAIPFGLGALLSKVG